MTKTEGLLFLAWLLGLLPTSFRFRRWVDARLAGLPKESERICDTIAHLETLLGIPWALLVEFQIRPVAVMFGRLLSYWGALWESAKPSEEAGDRFFVAALIVNLTGRGNTQTEYAWEEAHLQARFPIREVNLCDFSAKRVLADIVAGKAPGMALCWIPLMQGGAEPDIIEQWLTIARAEPDRHRRSDYGSLALVFAEAANNHEIWAEALGGWNVIESKQVLAWQAEARAEGEERGKKVGKKEGREEGIGIGELRRSHQMLLRLGQQKFGSATAATQKRLEAIDDLARLDRLIDAILTATSWKELLATK